jgi:hypothetical protein
MKYFLLLIMLDIFIINTAFSSEKTFIFCTDGKTEWKWLTDDQNNYIEAKGKWQEKSTSLNYTHIALMYKYFLLNNGIDDVEDLSEKCKKKFGNEFLIPQPANHGLNDWFLFAIDEEYLVGGKGDFKLTTFGIKTIAIINPIILSYRDDKLVLFISHEELMSKIVKFIYYIPPPFKL